MKLWLLLQDWICIIPRTIFAHYYNNSVIQWKECGYFLLRFVKKKKIFLNICITSCIYHFFSSQFNDFVGITIIIYQNFLISPLCQRKYVDDIWCEISAVTKTFQMLIIILIANTGQVNFYFIEQDITNKHLPKII